METIFFGSTLSKDAPLELELEPGCYFNLTGAMIPPRCLSNEKVYLIVREYNTDDDDDDDSEEEEEEKEKSEEEEPTFVDTPICLLEPGKIDQIQLNLTFSFEQDIIFMIDTKDSRVQVAISAKITEINEDENSVTPTNKKSNLLQLPDRNTNSKQQQQQQQPKQQQNKQNKQQQQQQKSPVEQQPNQQQQNNNKKNQQQPQKQQQQQQQQQNNNKKRENTEHQKNNPKNKKVKQA
eukprot:gene1357-1713_t